MYAEPYMLSHALDEFVQWGSAVYAPRTVDTYSDLLKRFIRFTGDRPVKEINISHVAKYVAQLKKKDYAEASIAYMMISIRVLFRFLHERRVIDWDYRLIKIPKYITNHFPTIKSEEILNMQKNIVVNDFRGLRDLVVVKFLAATGVRNSELCELRIDNIDTDAMVAKIQTKKSKKWRFVPWGADTNETIEQYLQEREVWAYDDAFIVSTSKKNLGRGITSRTIQRIVHKYRPAGKRIVPHSFRSSHLTKLLEEGVDLETIRRNAGHSSILCLEPYLRISQKYIVDKVRVARGFVG